eukprot:420843_1
MLRPSQRTTKIRNIESLYGDEPKGLYEMEPQRKRQKQNVVDKSEINFALAHNQLIQDESKFNLPSKTVKLSGTVSATTTIKNIHQVALPSITAKILPHNNVKSNENYINHSTNASVNIFSKETPSNPIIEPIIDYSTNSYVPLKSDSHNYVSYVNDNISNGYTAPSISTCSPMSHSQQINNHNSEYGTSCNCCPPNSKTNDVQSNAIHYNYVQHNSYPCTCGNCPQNIGINTYDYNNVSQHQMSKTNDAIHYGKPNACTCGECQTIMVPCDCGNCGYNTRKQQHYTPTASYNSYSTDCGSESLIMIQ